ncbi:MAG: transporter permease [Massilia sp.]|jgi:branched-chain amino acid transport system substrate-binding protein|nr:transporter permease [Massilia sp.]MDB5948965.1 transporter permease [Massilia sp.]
MNSKKIAATAILVGAACGAQAQVSGGVVKIGVLTDLSGTYSDLAGKGSIIATKMAIDDFIAKEKPSFKIEMVSADHQNKPDIASSKAREWLERDNVDTVTDLVTTPVALAVMKVGKERDRLIMPTATASSSVTNENCNDVTIHYAYDTNALAHGTAKAVTQQGGKTWFFLTADYAFGHASEKDAAAVVTANGGKVLGAVRHPFPTNDFSSFLLKAQSSGAQVIGLANAGSDTANAIKQAGEFGITPKQSLAGLMMFISDVHSLGLKNTQGMYLTTGFYWDRNDETRAWSKRFFEQRQRMPTMVHAGQYSSIYHYLKAVKAAGTDDTKKVIALMKKTPVNDFFAKNGVIRDDGRMVHDMYLVQVKKPSESKYPWDYYTVKATIPGEEAFVALKDSRCSLVKK